MSNALHRFTRDAMACTFEILLGGDEREAGEAAAAAWEELDRLEQELSRFVTTSDIARINSAAGTRPVLVGLAAWDVLVMAEEVRRQTGGAFDVTWGSANRAATGEATVVLDPAAQTAYVPAGRRVDLGAIGKGYALDEMAAALRRWGVTQGLLASGQSTVLVMGTAEVALRDPAQSHRPVGKVRLVDYALSGSGMLLHGPHIIDPATGRPAGGKLATWAAAPSGAISDALSTAFMVMTPDAVAGFCATFGDVVALTMAPGAPIVSHGAAAGVQISL